MTKADCSGLRQMVRQMVRYIVSQEKYSVPYGVLPRAFSGRTLYGTPNPLQLGHWRGLPIVGGPWGPPISGFDTKQMAFRASLSFELK